MILAIVYCSEGNSSYYNPGASPPEDKILMDHISTVTFYDNRYTMSRRGRSIPQLRCVGGDARFSNYNPREITCRNLGSDGISHKWQCEAATDKMYRLGKVHVHCEGYNGSGDRYIVKGSCALDYELWYTESGQHQPHRQIEETNGLGLFGTFFIIALLILIAIVCGSSRRTSNTNYDSTPSYNPNAGRYPNSYSDRGDGSTFSKAATEEYTHYRFRNEGSNDREHTTVGYGNSSSR